MESFFSFSKKTRMGKRNRELLELLIIVFFLFLCYKLRILIYQIIDCFNLLRYILIPRKKLIIWNGTSMYYAWYQLAVAGLWWRRFPRCQPRRCSGVWFDSMRPALRHLRESSTRRISRAHGRTKTETPNRRNARTRLRRNGGASWFAPESLLSSAFDQFYFHGSITCFPAPFLNATATALAPHHRSRSWNKLEQTRRKNTIE